jgi:predicted Zn finger-like uncharacterized protein
MHIVCPHCTTSYAVDPATLGVAGRTVRCSRCKEVWLARPEDAVAVVAAVPATAAGLSADGREADAEWQASTRADDRRERDVPVIDSPSISADWSHDAAPVPEADWPATARNEPVASEADNGAGGGRSRRRSWRPRLWKPRATRRTPRQSSTGLSTACVAMSALVMALIIWRGDVVRLLPQTATFYKTVGLEVNLRGLTFRDVKISNETVDGKPVLVIEGQIVAETHKTVELPRLRFSVRDAHGAEIYAWNAVMDQPVLKPGEKAWFKSRLASPPPEGRNIDVRFFTKRDIAGGSA